MFPTAALLLAATLGPNTSQTAYASMSPVRIAACSVEPEYRLDNTDGVPTSTILGTQLEIRFVNTASKPLSSVTFGVSEGSGATMQIVDAGTFAPGVSIDHTFRVPTLYADQANCTTNTAAFADGSNWTAASITAAR